MAKGRIVVDEERCKGCELCVSACPPVLLQIDRAHLNGRGYHPAQLVDPDGKCSGCALCAVMCPEACITVFRARLPRPQMAQVVAV